MKDNGVVWPDMQESSVGTMVSYQDGVAPQNGSSASVQDQARFEADKRAVYKHPLFPLLALLFERCEQATQLAETPSSESFNLDIQAFVQHQERDRKPFLVNDAEIDGLMIKAIQVLRIHLLELEKVQELCKDFCNRYITALKGKMQSENLLRSDYAAGYLENNNNSGHSSDSNSPTVFAPHSPHNLQVGLGGWQATSGSGTGVNQAASTTSSGVQGSTPLSQIGVSPHPPSTDSLSTTSQGCLTSGGSCDEDDDPLGRGGKKQKRGVLPKQATSIMRSWLFQHLVHPYPTEDEKRQIAAQTDLTLLQVNNWFINARRRILQPMLDASNPNEPSAAGGGSIKPGQIAKKSKMNGLKPSQRYWPDGMGRLSVDSTLEGSDEWDSDEDGSATSSVAPVLSSDAHSIRDALPISQPSDDSQQ